MDKNSMLHWYPLAQYAGVPMPETIIVWTGHNPLMEILDGVALPDHFSEFIRLAARKIGYPLFLRTDQASGKHDWEKTCYVPSEETLMAHVARVVEFNECAGFLGLDYEAIVLRKFIPLEHKFLAFHGNMPVAKERRYFIRHGKVECHHPYWPAEAIEESHNKPGNWQELLAELNQETENEITLLTGYAEQLGKYLHEYWSVDFAKGQDGRWYFIDAALGEQSWHPVCAYHYPNLQAQNLGTKEDPAVNIFLIDKEDHANERKIG